MSNNLIIYIVIGVIIVFSIHKFSRKEENFDREDYNNYNDIIRFKKEDIPILKRSVPAPIKGDHEYQHIDYLTDNLSPKTENCMLPPKSSKKFHNDFFSFRDMTQLNSSMRKDAVDNINSMILNGNVEQARRQPNMKIQDIYNEAVKTPERYHDNCTRLPYFDNTNPHGWHDNYGTPGIHITRDNWEYPNEKIINGGNITDMMTGHDPHSDNNLDLNAYD